MKIRSLLSPLLVGAAAFAMNNAQAVDPNVALGKPVTLTQGSALGVALSSLTDGLLVGNGTFYQSGTVFWSTPDAPIFEVNLGGLYAIGSITLEHDNNDIYLAVYPTGNSVGFAAIGPNVNGGGMNMSTYTFGAPIVASRISFLGLGGDGLYALSEIAINGVAVIPEPDGYAMMLAGLVLMGGVVARRRSRNGV